MKSIQGKLIIIFTLLIFVLSTFLGWISIDKASSSLLNKSHEELESIASLKAEYIETVIKGELQYVQALAQNSIILDEDISREEKIDFFNREAKRTGYDAFLFVEKDGNAVSLDGKEQRGNVSSREYFQLALDGIPNTSDIIVSLESNDTIINFATPIYKDGILAGVFYGRKTANAISEIIAEFEYGETGFAYMVNNEGAAVADKDTDLVINRVNYLEIAKEEPGFESLGSFMSNKMLTGKVGTGTYTYEGRTMIAGFAPVKNTPWILSVAIEEEEILDDIKGLRDYLVLFAAGSIVIGGLITFSISKRITQPIKAATHAIESFGELDFTVDKDHKAYKYINRQDEVGRMLQSLKHTRDNINQFIKKMIGSVEQVAASSEELTATSQQVSITSSEVAKTIEEIAEGAMEQAKDTETGVVHMDGLKEIVQKNDKQVEVLNQSAQKIIEAKEQGLETLKEVLEHTSSMQVAIERIQSITLKTDNSGKKIYTASDMIHDISEQTNLLALNAAIESARAGEAGRGFAVVAEEIRKLAEQSSQFASEITMTVDELTSETGEAVDAMEKVNTVVKKQNKAIDATDSAFNSITEAIEENHLVIEGLNESSKAIQEKREEIKIMIESLSSIAEENAAGTQESTASIEEQTATLGEIANASEDLAKIAQEVQEEIQKFKV